MPDWQRRHLIVSFISCNPLAAHAAHPFLDGFRGIKWGANPPKGFRQVGKTTKDALSVYGSETSSALTPWEGFKVSEEALLFEKNKLYAGHIYLDAAAPYEAVLARLVQLLGKPSFKNEARRIVRWRGLQGRIDAMYYAEQSGRTVLAISRE